MVEVTQAEALANQICGKADVAALLAYGMAADKAGYERGLREAVDVIDDLEFDFTSDYQSASEIIGDCILCKLMRSGDMIHRSAWGDSCLNQIWIGLVFHRCGWVPRSWRSKREDSRS